MALVETPRAVDRDPHQVHLVEHRPEGPDGALEDRRVGYVEGVALLLQDLAAFLGFLATLLGEIDVRPAGEAVLLVPRAFAVADENEFRHRLYAFRPRYLAE